MNCTECVVEDTHLKFREATYFLSKCATCYHEPTEFIFNLNAFLQALRNITFMLQSEPGRPAGFETWYADKQVDLRRSELLRRFVQARNVLVKQSSLKARSEAWSGVFRHRHLKLGMQHQVPLFAPSTCVLGKLKEHVGFFLDEAHSQPWEQFGVFRAWKVDELGDTEVLGLCVQALNSVGHVVEDAHRYFGGQVQPAEVQLDMLRTQALLETDVDPSLVAKWGWTGQM